MSSTATAIQVRERPILFSGPMVRAILEGRKTQTRRVVKALPEWFNRVHTCSGEIDRATGQTLRHDCLSDSTGEFYQFCPYGAPGDVLWVREALRWTDWLVYDSDKTPVDPDLMPARFRINKDFAPGIFMPRWASRLLLQITSIRVERLQQISEDDAIAEGMTRSENTGMYPSPQGNCDYAAWAFKYGWDAINGKRAPWESNPWVWAITFAVIGENSGIQKAKTIC